MILNRLSDKQFLKQIVIYRIYSKPEIKKKNKQCKGRRKGFRLDLSAYNNSRSSSCQARSPTGTGVTTIGLRTRFLLAGAIGTIIASIAVGGWIYLLGIGAQLRGIPCLRGCAEPLSGRRRYHRHMGASPGDRCRMLDPTTAPIAHWKLGGDSVSR